MSGASFLLLLAYKAVLSKITEKIVVLIQHSKYIFNLYKAGIGNSLCVNSNFVVVGESCTPRYARGSMLKVLKVMLKVPEPLLLIIDCRNREKIGKNGF